MSTIVWGQNLRLGSTFLASLLLTLPASAALDLQDYPLFLASTGVTPNIVLTIDDSYSMWYAFVPDRCGSSDTCAYVNDHRYAKSSHNNALYYDPNVVYTPPKNAAGTSLPSSSDPSDPDTVFSTVYRNGFDTSFGTVDMTKGYRPTSTLKLPGAGTTPTEVWMEHYVLSTGKTELTITEEYAEHSHTGTTTNTTSPPTYSILDYQNVDGLQSGQPGSNLISVTVDSNTLTDAGTFSGSCTTSNDPSFSSYKTQISGTTLTFCLSNDTSSCGKNCTKNRKGKSITVVHKITPGPTKSVGQTDPGPAYYYSFNEANTNCIGTEAQKSENDFCYSIVLVSSTSGPNGNDERQNFANWYAFYRTRNLATVSSASLAFSHLDADSRVAWQSLSSCKLPTTTCQGWKNSFTDNKSNAIDLFTGDHRIDFYDWLFQVPTKGYTPLREASIRAGNYFKATGEKPGSTGPYANDIGSDSTEYYACRRNYHVLMTDGVWRSDPTSPFSGGPGNADGTNTQLPQDNTQAPAVIKSYTADKPYHEPYKDGYSNSLADIAFNYWKTDLWTNTVKENNIVTAYVDAPDTEPDKQYWNPKNDPANWQHLVTYTVGLGVTGFLSSGSPALTWAGDTFSGSYPDIADNKIEWPKPADNDDNNISDLWHAAVNSRGRFFSGETPDDIISAFDDILDTIAHIDSAGGGAALSTNTAVVSSDTAVYKASFRGDGSGNVIALPFANGGLGDDTDAYWQAAAGIPIHTDRKIFTTNTTNPTDIGNGKGEEFNSCDRALLKALNEKSESAGDTDVEDLCARRLNFLRSNWLPGSGAVTGATWSSGSGVTFIVNGHGFIAGDKVKVSGIVPASFNGTYTLTAAETNTFRAAKAINPGNYTRGGTVAYADFRNRTSSVLGGITHSAPAYVHAEDYGYGSGSVVVTGRDSYHTYVSLTKKARRPMLYVGANDGMLHGFYAPSCHSTSTCAAVKAGQELLAYVPRGVYGRLSKLTDPSYSSTFYVDGSPTIGDAYIGNDWKTYLVGSLRGGGRSIFALDIGRPSTIVDGTPNTMTANDVKWEFTDDHLWQTYSQPQIGADTEDRWVAVFGSGYKDSKDTSETTDKAYLYVVNLADGTKIQDPISPSDVTSNGLSTPALYDRDGNGVVDVAYAGDLKGNLWKFVNEAGTWKVGNNKNALFTATVGTTAQPITVQPKVAPLYLDGKQNGVLVYFGTGKYLEPDDLVTSQAQSFYAFWDKDDGTDRDTFDRDDLFGYQIDIERVVSGTDSKGKPYSYTVRTTSAKSTGSVNWSTQYGWYLDLPSPATGKPAERIISPAVVLTFDSVPDRVLFVTNVLNSDPCQRGGTSWLMELDLTTGSRTAESVYDFNNDGKFGSADKVKDSGNNDVAASGVALPPDYGLTGAPLILVDKVNGTITKAFTGSTGRSGTPTATQSADKAGTQLCYPNLLATDPVTGNLLVAHSPGLRA